jgi:enolase
VEDTKKYEWDGPKNPLDINQLIDFYDKIVADHPLVEYIEDCFAASDIKGLKKYVKQTRVSGKLSVGIN